MIGSQIRMEADRATAGNRRTITSPPIKRIAWIGPTPTAGGGATSVGSQLLLELARRGIEVDCFIAGAAADVDPALDDVEYLRFFYVPKRWSWGRWYSQTPLVAFLSGHLAQARAQYALAKLIATRHRADPYDVVYQFSQSEHGPLRRHRHRLPPIVIHPSTHAAGELRWVRREADLARKTEPLVRRLLVPMVLGARALIQRYEMPRIDRVVGVSRRFSELLASDYRIPPSQLGVVPNPIDLDRFRPPAAGEARQGPVRLVFLSRISARKGVEYVIELSHRLSDLRGQVWIQVFGGATLWSNYLPLLDGLNPELATFEGQVSPEQAAAVYAAADMLLQPALYEPFGLTVAEALASGLPIVVSDEVGAIDGLDPRVCEIFPAGDMDAFEAAVRRMISRVSAPERFSMLRLARAEAERLFAPAVVGERLVAELAAAVANNPDEVSQSTFG